VLDPSRPFVYYSPAVLFDAPYTLQVGTPLTLRYGVLVHPGRATREMLDDEWKSFWSTSPKAGD